MPQESQSVQLSRLELYEVRGEIANLYVSGEELLFAGRESSQKRWLFTTRRLIIVEDLEGGRHSFTFLPHTRLQYYALETREINSRSEAPVINLLYASGLQLLIQFRDSVDLERLQLVLMEQM